MSSNDHSLERLFGRALAKWPDAITDGETGKRGVIVRPSEDGDVTIMKDAETGGRAVVFWLTGSSN